MHWPIRYRADLNINRLLANGLSNAIKFCKDHPITVSLTTSPDLTHLILRVIDQGIGIDPKSLSRLFLPFTKQNSFSPGVGLGLYITKALVKRMRGTLNLTSVLGKGTTFEVALPIQFKSSPTDSGTLGRQVIDSAAMVKSKSRDSGLRGSISPTSESPTGSYAKQNPIRVLVVDDNEISRRLLVMGLKKSTTPVVSAQAYDGENALEVFREFKPHIVFTGMFCRMLSVTVCACANGAIWL